MEFELVVVEFDLDELAPPPWLVLASGVVGWIFAEKAKATTGRLADRTRTRAPTTKSFRRAGCSEVLVATADCVL